MSSLITRREHSPLDMNNFINGISGIKTVGDSRPQIPQRNLPIEERWIVQKFGGTSIGKFPVKIVEDIIV